MSWIDAYRADGRLEGHCLCGDVRITVDGPHLAAVGVCHCSMCKRWAGHTYGTFEAPPESVTVTGEVRSYASTDFAHRAFCPNCGSHLWMRNGEGDYELQPGLFPGAEDFPLVSEIYKDKAPAYAQLSGDHRHATQAEYEAKNPHIEGNTP